MKKLNYFIVAIFIAGLGISCTPEAGASDVNKNKPEIYGTGDDQSVYPDNDRD